ncbi:MAG: type II secretion system F family protein [Planctomycetes bacterium]|nr:type II secretion system F family protein [Planctomycetota bacterium]
MPFPLACALVFGSVLLASLAAVEGLAGVWERARGRYVNAAEESLDAAWLTWPARRVLGAGIASAFVLGGACALAHPAWAPAGAGVGLLLPLGALWTLARRRAERARAALPEALEAISRSLRAGSALPQAVSRAAGSVAGPMGRELALVSRELGLGVPLEEALSHWHERVGDADLALAVEGIRLAQEVGGTLSETLQNLVVTVRERRRAQARLNALTAQGRMQAWVVGLLPFGLAGFLAWMDPEGMAEFLRRPAGVSLVALAAILQAVGIAWIRWIVRP